MSKPLHAGHAASSGLRSALLAARGLTGAEAILEGDKGLFRGLCPDARPAAVLEAAAGWKLPETSMKPYPCCRHVHPAIDAAIELRENARDSLPERVLVQSYPAALDVTDRPHPQTPHEARFSLQYAVATTLLRGRPGLGDFEAAAVGDGRIRSLLNRIEVETDATLAADYPDRWGARVSIREEDGTERSAVRRSATGDPDQPLDDEALDAKVADLFRWGGLTTIQTHRILRSCRTLTRNGPIPALPRATSTD